MEILDRWRARRDELERLGASVNGAMLCEEAIRDLEAVLAGSGSEALTLAEAAVRSGYSRDHLARLVRQGDLANVGRKHAPRVLARELPRKPKVAGAGAGSYDTSADARAALGIRR